MSEPRPPLSPPSAPETGSQGERLVYVMPEGGFVGGSADDEIDLLELWNILWQGKWLVIASTVVFAVGSVIYALAQTHWYRSEVLLAPAEGRSAPALGGQLGGLAALAGVSVGGGGAAEPLAVLNSRDFTRAFIQDLDLMPVLFEDAWDAERGAWADPDPEEWPDLRDGVRAFQDIVSVSEDRSGGLVTLAVEWTDPELAAQWASALTARLNQRLRERALQEAEANVAYLQAELAQTSVVTLQQSIGRLLEAELQKLMLARGNEEFAFRVIDAAEVPKSPSRPRRSLIAIIGTMLGGMLGVFAVFVRHAVRRAKTPTPSEQATA